MSDNDDIAYPPCKGMNCGATDGRSHSPECEAEHAAAIAGGVFLKPTPQPCAASPADMAVYQSIADGYPQAAQQPSAKPAQGEVWGDDETNDLMHVISMLDKIVAGETTTASDRLFDRSVRPRKMTIKDAQGLASPAANILRKLHAKVFAPPSPPVALDAQQGEGDALVVADDIEDKTLLPGDIRNVAARTIRALALRAQPTPLELSAYRMSRAFCVKVESGLAKSKATYAEARLIVEQFEAKFGKDRIA